MEGQPCIVRRDAGLYGYERALERHGLGPVAGSDEAGRGACAGPLVAAAVILPPGRRRRVLGLADSKALTPSAREEACGRIVRRALAVSVVTVSAAEIDRRGLQECNLASMRRAVAQLDRAPSYVLTDGFPVRGLDVSGLAVRRGDEAVACVAAASIVAKVSRDRMMCELDERFPEYGFAAHKGYVTPQHTLALTAHGACAEHRFSYVNVPELRAGDPAEVPARDGRDVTSDDDTAAEVVAHVR